MRFDIRGRGIRPSSASPPVRAYPLIRHNQSQEPKLYRKAESIACSANAPIIGGHQAIGGHFDRRHADPVAEESSPIATLSLTNYQSPTT